MDANGKLVLVDGSSLLYRAFFALPPLTTTDGRPTNAVFGFASMLFKILEEERPGTILAAFEGGATFRHREFHDYKAQRPRAPSELASQLAPARQLAEALGVPVISHPGYEADDVIGTLARSGAEAGRHVVIVTGDLDALQLVDPRVEVLVQKRGVSEVARYDPEAVRARYGLDAGQLPDFKALKGDPSDNIPGLPGIGDKTATALLVQYGSLEGLLAHAADLKPGKVRTSVIEGREDALLFKRLATIVTDVPIATTWDEWRYRGPDRSAAVALLEHLEFHSLLPRLPPTGEPVPESEPPASVAFEPPPPTHELTAWLNELRAEGRVVVGMAMPGVSEGASAVAARAAGRTLVWPSVAALPEPIRDLLRDGSIELLAADTKRMLQTLGLAGTTGTGEGAPRIGFDALLAGYVLNPGRTAYRLAGLARECGVAVPDLERGSGSERAAAEAGLVAAVEMAAVDCLRRDGLERVFRHLELPLVPILAGMEAVGVAVDPLALRALSARLGDRIRTIEAQAHVVADRTFNLGSPKQLAEILFQEAGLPGLRKTKTGYSTDSDVLQELALIHPLPPLILEFRELSKLKSTYADTLPQLIDPADGRIHTRLNQAVAATGRLSSSEPNLQNIPVRTAEGREIRAAFVAAPGMRLLTADYSQIELRVMAHFSKDPELTRAFQEGEDVHVATAARIFGVPPERVTSEQRRQAKTVNFAVLYGQREFGLSRQLRIPLGEARELVAGYLARFPGVRRYADQTVEQARRDGYVTTLPPFSRKRYIPGIHAGNRNERQAAEREAVNAPVQGTAADIIKAAMLCVDADLRDSQLRARMILQVHDELLFEVACGEEARLGRLVKNAMETAYPLDVPLGVEVRAGDNWRDLAPVEHP
jgi:DNA polymerase-1